MFAKPKAKPVVLGVLNPLANGRLTIKQNKTKQDKVGFGSLNQNQNPPYLLVSQLYKQGFFSCFFSLRSCFVRLIRALEGFLAIEYAQHERNGEHMEMHPCYRKKYQPQINLADGGRGIRSAFLSVSGFYFSGREAISFNEDGFIGIAGWADDTNVKPFLRAFHKWVCEWMIGVTYR